MQPFDPTPLSLTQEQHQLQETKRNISLEVKQAYLQLNESAKRVELSGASLEQTEENLRLRNDGLKAGTITDQDVAGSSIDLATDVQRYYRCKNSLPH